MDEVKYTVVQHAVDVTPELIEYIDNFITEVANETSAVSYAFYPSRDDSGGQKPKWEVILGALEGEIFQGTRLQFGNDYRSEAARKIKRGLTNKVWYPTTSE